MIRVNIKFHGELRKLFEMQVSKGIVYLRDGSTIQELNDYVGISPKDIVVILLNGIAMSPYTILKDGDQVDFFTPLSGG